MDGEEIRRVYRESIGVLSVSLLGGLFAGGVLGSEPMRAAFRQYPGLLLLLPAFLATRGNSNNSPGYCRSAARIGSDRKSVV